MAKKTVGYIELHWECPNCATINPGGEKVCRGCGAPQPENVEFFQPTQQQLIEDEERLKQIKAGPDIHCGYCGARNPGNAVKCVQCGGDLSEGKKREAGKVLGAFQAGEARQIPCPNCGAQNPETASRCSQCGGSLSRQPEQMHPAAPIPAGKPKRGGLLILGLLLVGVCAAIYFIFLRTTALTGTVTGVEWERSYVVLGLVPVEHEDWYDQIPADGEIVSCTEEKRSETDQPTDGAVEVCGTPYSVDTGTGAAEVVQDCIYEIYDDYCTYTQVEWGAVDTVTTSGSDFNVYWPDPALGQDERLGEGSESYTIIFSADGDTYRFPTDDYNLFQSVEIGSKWELEVNSIGGVQAINP